MVGTAQSTRRDLLTSQKVDPAMEVPLSVETLQAAMPATSSTPMVLKVEQSTEAIESMFSNNVRLSAHRPRDLLGASVFGRCLKFATSSANSTLNAPLLCLALPTINLNLATNQPEGNIFKTFLKQSLGELDEQHSIFVDVPRTTMWSEKRGYLTMLETGDRRSVDPMARLARR